LFLFPTSSWPTIQHKSNWCHLLSCRQITCHQMQIRHSCVLRERERERETTEVRVDVYWQSVKNRLDTTITHCSVVVYVTDGEGWWELCVCSTEIIKDHGRQCQHLSNRFWFWVWLWVSPLQDFIWELLYFVLLSELVTDCYFLCIVLLGWALGCHCVLSCSRYLESTLMLN